jgi:hypothetical protein
VIPRGERADAIEVKWSAEAFESKHLAHFRTLYPHGENLLVTGATTRASVRAFGDISVRVVPVAELRRTLAALP